ASSNAKLTFSGTETNGSTDTGAYWITVPATTNGPVNTPNETFFCVSSASASGTKPLVLQANGGFDWFYLPAAWTGQIEITNDSSGLGGIDAGTGIVGGAASVDIGGSASAPLTYNGSNNWSGADGNNGTCQVSLQNNQLKISDSSWGTGTVVID